MQVGWGPAARASAADAYEEHMLLPDGSPLLSCWLIVAQLRQLHSTVRHQSLC